MKRNLSRYDRALLESAWREVSGTSTVRKRKSTAPFRAQYAGFCGRCGRAVEIGQMIQCHRDFDGVVHTGCHAPEIIVRATEAVTAPPPRGGQPPLCPDCHLEHAGPCW